MKSRFMIILSVFTFRYDIKLSESINTNLINTTHELGALRDTFIITKLFLKM
jgi:hypothetical protein